MSANDILNINGMAVPCQFGEVEFTPKPIGIQERGAGVAEMRDFARAFKHDGSISMAPVIPVDGDAWENVIQGRCVRWSFDESLVGDFGVAPATGSTATIGTTAPAAKFGAARVKVPSATSLVYNFNVMTPDTRWTMLWWFWNDVSLSWDHYMLRSDAVKYKNGVTVGTVVAPLSVSSALDSTSTYASITLTLLGKDITGVSSKDAFYDEVVFLPYLLSPNLLAAHYAAGVVWGRGRRLNVSGTLVEVGTIECFGAVTSSKRLPGQWYNGTWYNNLRQISFSLVQR